MWGFRDDMKAFEIYPRDARNQIMWGFRDDMKSFEIYPRDARK